jgi:hypothetical protein
LSLVTQFKFEKHESAIVESPHIGGGTYIGAMAHVWPDAVIGERVTIGANATVPAGVSIGDDATIGAGSVVASDVPRGAIAAGNPARVIGFNKASPAAGVVSRAPAEIGIGGTSVAGVKLHRMPHLLDPRGPLSFGEVGGLVPFEVKRYFLVFDVASEEIRGEHAHRTLHQFLLCVHGCCHLMADDGRNSEDFVLDSPSIGVHLPPMVWGVQHKYTHDAVLLVLASEKYDPADYIRNYAEFLELVKGVR